jgi:hypothetical protein
VNPFPRHNTCACRPSRRPPRASKKHRPISPHCTRLVDQNGNPKAILAFGEQKSLQTDRVVLEPGPVEEVETVHRMFRMFVYEEKHQREIAAILNKEQIRTDLGRRWTAGSTAQPVTGVATLSEAQLDQSALAGELPSPTARGCIHRPWRASPS